MYERMASISTRFLGCSSKFRLLLVSVDGRAVSATASYVDRFNPFHSTQGMYVCPQASALAGRRGVCMYAAGTKLPGSNYTLGGKIPESSVSPDQGYPESAYKGVLCLSGEC